MRFLIITFYYANETYIIKNLNVSDWKKKWNVKVRKIRTKIFIPVLALKQLNQLIYNQFVVLIETLFESVVTNLQIITWKEHVI